MNRICSLAVLLTCFGCSNPHPPVKKATAPLPSPDTVATIAKTGTVVPDIEYATAQKLHFIDSVNNADLQPLADTIAHWPDSVFRFRKNMDITLSDADFKELKHVFTSSPHNRTSSIDVAAAVRIFKGFDIVRDSQFVYEGSVSLDLIPFSKNRFAFDEYAICIGDRSASSWENDVYFFRKNHLIAMHHINHHYGLEMDYFKDEKGRTMVFYKENFGTGSGIWQFNYYFYVYNDNKLSPALNVLQNGNYTWGGPRNFWLETKIASYKPLRLRFQYHFSFCDYSHPDMLSTAEVVTYRQDSLGCYTGDFSRVKINPGKMITYYLDVNELLFVKAYYKELQQWLGGKNRAKKQLALNYINMVMNVVYNSSQQ